MDEKKTFFLSGDLAETDKRRSYYLFNDTLKRYYNAHSRALAMSYHVLENYNELKTDSKLLKLSARLQNCGDFLHFRDYYTIEERQLYNAYFCNKHLLCPFCAIRRGAKQVRAYMEKLELILQDDSDLEPYMITFTIKNRDDLSSAFEHLTNSFKRLLHARRDSYRKNRRFFEFAKAEGAVYSIELKRGENSGEWHPHIHCLVLSKKGFNKKKLKREWEYITKDSFNVDVRRCYGDSIVKSFCEVFKYALKFSDLSIEDNFLAFQQLSGRRLTGSFGSFYGVKIPESLLDDALDDEDLPYYDVYYSYCCGSYRQTDKIHKSEYSQEYLDYMKNRDDRDKRIQKDALKALRERDLFNMFRNRKT